MRVTLVSFGSEGDLRPQLALAGGLKAAGHSVVVVAEESGAVLTAAAGVEFVGLVGDLVDVTSTGVRRARVRLRWPDREWLETIARAAAGSDVVVGLPAASYHAVAAADQVGAVAVLAGLQPILPTAEFVPSVLGKPRLPARLNRGIGRFVDELEWSVAGSRVNGTRRELGLAPMPNPYDSVPFLGGWSSLLVPTPADWDASQVTVTGQWHAASQGFTPEPALEAFLKAEERPIYVGFGSLKGPKVAYALEQVLKAYAGTYRIVLSAHPSITTELPHERAARRRRPARLAVPEVRRDRAPLRGRYDACGCTGGRPVGTGAVHARPAVLGGPSAPPGRGEPPGRPEVGPRGVRGTLARDRRSQGAGRGPGRADRARGRGPPGSAAIEHLATATALTPPKQLRQLGERSCTARREILYRSARDSVPLGERSCTARREISYRLRDPRGSLPCQQRRLRLRAGWRLHHELPRDAVGEDDQQDQGDGRGLERGEPDQPCDGRYGGQEHDEPVHDRDQPAEPAERPSDLGAVEGDQADGRDHADQGRHREAGAPDERVAGVDLREGAHQPGDEERQVHPAGQRAPSRLGPPLRMALDDGPPQADQREARHRHQGVEVCEAHAPSSLAAAAE